MDFYVCLARPGSRVARRKRASAKVGAQHKIKQEDSINWFKQKYDAIVLSK